MPCYSEGHITKEDTMKDTIAKYEGMLCAVFNELDRRNISCEVAVNASRSGLINVMEWYTLHRDDDISRLEKELHKYSKDEQYVIFDILHKQLCGMK